MLVITAGTVAAVLARPLPVRADAVDDCIAAAVRGQKQQKAAQLVDARESFETCARRECPANVAKDCTAWLSEVDDAIPTLLVAARDGAGQDLLDVQVTIDGARTVATGSGQALALDPGPHVLRFVRAGASPVEQTIVLREGEKRRQVLVTFAAAPPREREPVAESRTVPTSVYVLGGVSGVAFLGALVVGGLAASDYSASRCSAGCDPSAAARVRTEQRVTDVALVAGVISAGVTLWLYLTRPSGGGAISPIASIRASGQRFTLSSYMQCPSAGDAFSVTQSWPHALSD
jgi:hypothetical protein